MCRLSWKFAFIFFNIQINKNKQIFKICVTSNVCKIIKREILYEINAYMCVCVRDILIDLFHAYVSLIAYERSLGFEDSASEVVSHAHCCK